MNLTQQLNLIFDQNKAYTVDQLIRLIGLSPKDKSLLLHTLKGMDIFFDKGKYGTYAAFGYVRGRLQSTQKDYNFVIPDDGSEDIFVPDENALGAMHGDTVICLPFERGGDNVRAYNGRDKKSASGKFKSGHKKGKILKVLEHANKSIVGQCVFRGDRVYVVPSNARLKRTVLLSGKAMATKMREYELVRCNIISFTQKGPILGELAEVLGYNDEKGVDILCLIREHNLPDEFPPQVMELAQSIKEKGVNEQGRVDLCHKLIFTMDGADAKDLDDAISIEKDKNCWILGVHIADVSHYVRPDSPLDSEARKRGTSVYFPGKVLPMLPEPLSNGICSLSPNEKRLCLSVEMKIDCDGNVVSSKIFPSVICSSYRLTYEGAVEILNGAQSDNKLKDALKQAKELADILKERRQRRGALDFELPEPCFTLDQNNRAINVEVKNRLVTHKIIEQFMLAANTVVAEFMSANSLPALYRVHEYPDAAKLEELDGILKPFGFSVEHEKISPASCSELLKAVSGTKQERLANMLLLRSMKKARYCSDNLGHFGLAEDNYLHFTSPIRRYPDLIVHRILHFYFDKDQKAINRYRKDVDGLATLTSDREVAAAEAERDADDMKKAEFAQALIGKSFEGVISGINQSVMWVELENTIECVVPRQNMDDSYIFDQDRMTLLARRTRKLLSMGDTVTVTVTDSDPVRRVIEAAMGNGASSKSREKDKPERKKPAKRDANPKEKSRSKHKSTKKYDKKSKKASKRRTRK